MQAPPHVDPRKCTIALDSNVLEQAGPVRSPLVKRFRALQESGVIKVLTVSNNRDAFPRSYDAGISQLGGVVRSILLALPQGKDRKYEYGQDASSFLDSLEVDSRYFITDDRSLLSKREGVLHDAPLLFILTLEEFFAIYQTWVDWNS